MWRRPQQELLDEMIATGMEAVLVKVAAMGLDPARHLGKTIGAMRNRLVDLHAKFELHVCGEGGEYETLVLNCPLYKSRIVLDHAEVVIHSDDAFAPVGYLVIRAAHLERKDPLEYTAALQHALAAVRPSNHELAAVDSSMSTLPVIAADVAGPCLGGSAAGHGFFVMHGLTAPRETLESEVEAALATLLGILSQHSMSKENIVQIRLLVGFFQAGLSMGFISG